MSSRVYEDSVKIDTTGYFKIKDTVSKNLLLGRSFSYKIKYPTIKETITIHPKPINQLYIGGGVEGNKIDVVSGIKAGVLFKNKKDQIFGIHTGLNRQGNITFGVDSYWKIKLKR